MKLFRLPTWMMCERMMKIFRSLYFGIYLVIKQIVWEIWYLQGFFSFRLISITELGMSSVHHFDSLKFWLAIRHLMMLLLLFLRICKTFNSSRWHELESFSRIFIRYCVLTFNINKFWIIITSITHRADLLFFVGGINFWGFHCRFVQCHFWDFRSNLSRERWNFNFFFVSFFKFSHEWESRMKSYYS